MTDENESTEVETTTETTTVETPEGTTIEESTEERFEKDESPAEPVQDQSADTVAQENPSTPAHEVVEETHEQQAENSGVEDDD